MTLLIRQIARLMTSGAFWIALYLQADPQEKAQSPHLPRLRLASLTGGLHVVHTKAPIAHTSSGVACWSIQLQSQSVGRGLCCILKCVSCGLWSRTHHVPSYTGTPAEEPETSQFVQARRSFFRKTGGN